MKRTTLVNCYQENYKRLSFPGENFNVVQLQKLCTFFGDSLANNDWCSRDEYLVIYSRGNTRQLFNEEFTFIVQTAASDTAPDENSFSKISPEPRKSSSLQQSSTLYNVEKRLEVNIWKVVTIDSELSQAHPEIWGSLL